MELTDKPEIIVITRNQVDIIEKTILFLEKYNPLYVLDRTYDGSAKILREHKCRFVRTPFWWTGRRTSSSRNYGLKFCNPKSDVIFLDGDRFPVEGDLYDIENKDILLFKMSENDFRTEKRVTCRYGKANNLFYSCGLFMKRSIIDKIVDRFGELFPTSVENGWGSEDLMLGDICAYMGIKYHLSDRIVLNGKLESKYVDHKMLVRRFKIREKLNLKF